MRSETNGRTIPVPRADGLLIQPVGDELVVYDLESKEAHCLKELAAFVFTSVDGTATVGEIAASAGTQLSAAVSAEQVADAVAQLEDAKLLEGPPLLVLDGDDGVSRREMMRRVGYAGAAATVSTGMIMSIAAPTAMAACTGQPAGCNCNRAIPGGFVHDNQLCQSGHCCGSGPKDACNVGCCSDTQNGAGDCQCQGSATCPSLPNPPIASACCSGVCNSNAGTAC
jgi:hypothetical protein